MNEIKEIKIIANTEELDRAIKEYEEYGYNTTQLYSISPEIFKEKQKNIKEDGIVIMGYDCCILTYLINMPPFGVHALWCESLDELLEQMKSNKNK